MSRIIEEFKIIDEKLGARINELRKERGYTYVDISRVLQVSYQQIQKNLQGTDRICASRIPALAAFLNVSIGDLFVGIADFVPVESEQDRVLLNLVKEYRKLASNEKRRALVDVAKALNIEDSHA